MMHLVLVYTLLIAFMMVSTIPTFSGKLMGERIRREWVLPIFILAVSFVAYLVTYPYRDADAGLARLSRRDPGKFPALPRAREGAGGRRRQG